MHHLIQEDLDTMYDHSNNDTVAGVTNSVLNQKNLQYYTQLNEKEIKILRLIVHPMRQIHS